MSLNGQIHFNNLAAFAPRIFKVRLTILGRYALKVFTNIWFPVEYWDSSQNLPA